MFGAPQEESKGDGAVNLLVLGLNHRTAPLDLRERLTIDKEQLAPSLDFLSRYVGQGVVLSTCNRLEIYTFDNANTDLVSKVGNFLVSYSGMECSQLEMHLYQHRDGDCARHLFRVASGLDSMVAGERQILGQVRTAFSIASQHGYIRGPLSRLFHQAMRVGRRVHRDTNIGGYSRSVSRAGVQLARNLLGDLSQQQALVIGAGDAGRLVARALAHAGIRKVAVTNRTHWRAQDLARALGGVAVPFEELPNQLIDSDVVISSTGSPGYVLNWAMVQEAARHRSGRPLLLIDIAVPRDIEPRAGQLEGVQLYDIDDLQMVSEADAKGLQRNIAWAEEIVIEETQKFLDWWEGLDAESLIASIRQRAEKIRQRELARTLNKLNEQRPTDGAESGFDQFALHLDAMTSALVKKLLHHPTVFLKETRDPAHQELARQLFNVDGSGRRRGRK
jgi:glutamyl-tRNA reductase